MERIKEAIRLAKSRQDGSGHTQKHGSAGSSRAPHAPRVRTEPATDDQSISTAHISRPHIEKRRIVTHAANASGAAPFDFLRTKLVQEMEQEGWRVLGITSPTPGCGKTFVSINLAISLSRHPDVSVVLLDLDLRKPSIASDLGLSPTKDLGDYIKGNATLEEITVHLDFVGPSLSVISNRRSIAQPSEVIVSQQIRTLIERLRSDPVRPFVIVDLPPILSADDVIAFLPSTDCCFLTVAEGETTAKDIEASEALLTSTNYLGCVLNKSREQTSHYYGAGDA